MENKIYHIDYEVIIPNPRDPEKTSSITIQVPVYKLCANGPEVLAEGATKLIEDTKARYMGLILPEEIKSLRTDEMLVSQKRFAQLLGLGAKTPSTWENGGDRPSRSMNLLLRLIQHFKPSAELLENLHQGELPRHTDKVIFFAKRQPETHQNWVSAITPTPSTEVAQQQEETYEYELAS